MTRGGRREGPGPHRHLFLHVYIKIDFIIPLFFLSQFGMWCHSPTPGPLTELAGLFCAEAAAAATAVPYPPLQKSPLPEAWPTSS